MAYMYSSACWMTFPKAHRYYLTIMAGNLSLLALAFYLGTVTAVQFPRQVTSGFTNSSVATTTQAPIDPSASGAFCCQVYAPAAGLHWWYTNGSIEAVRETVVTEYLRYNSK